MQLKKNAVAPYIPSLTPEYVDVNNKVKAQVLRDILRTGLFGIGAGAATGGIIGLMNANKKLPQYPIQTDVSLPYPQVKKKKKEQESEQAAMLTKMGSIAAMLGRNRQQPAAVTPIEKKSSDGDWADAFTRQFLSAPTVSQPTGGNGGGARTTTPISPAPGGVPLFSSAWFRGDSQTNPNSIPWALPAKGVAGVGGLIGGHQLVRYLLKKKRKADIDKELNAAKKEYQEAMLTSYDPAKLRELRPKEASAVTGMTALDRCFDIFEKYGNLDPLLGQAAGLYGAFAIPAATLAAIGGYRWARSRSQDKLLADALKRRAAIRAKQNPFDIHVQPTPVEYIDEEEEKKKKV